MRALHHCAPPFERLSSLSCKIRTVKAQAMALMSGIWFPTPRDRKYRQGRDLNQDGKSDESHPRLLVAQPSCDTADQPADAMPSTIQPEREVTLTLRQHAGHHGLEKRVLCRVADSPQQHSDEREIEAAHEHER